MTSLPNLCRLEVADILGDLPNVQALDVTRDMAEQTDDLFLVALGFEDRCPWISELLAECGQYRAIRATYFEYATNQVDNGLNGPRLTKAMRSFATEVLPPMLCDLDDFASQLRGILSEVCTKLECPQVTLDISTCSSKCLITVLTVLFEFNLRLRVVYSEADIYHPTKEEFNADPNRWTSDDKLGLARGVSAITRSPDHPGSRREVLPEAVIAFPTFKPERIRAILTDLDPSLLIRPENRVVWLIGGPHLPEDQWRKNVQRKINDVSPLAPVYEVSTFDYKKTLQVLEQVYLPFDCKYLVNVAPLGSKMQSLGVVLFWHIYPEVSVYFASPREYNATQYSEGCKAVWSIEFGQLTDIRKLFGLVGELRVAE